jgi:hypothetical protein
MEEFEAVDCYYRDACIYNVEEKEHPAMVLEWVRRPAPTFDKVLKGFFSLKSPCHTTEYLFK